MSLRSDFCSMIYGATSLVFSVNGLLTAPGEKHTSHRSIPIQKERGEGGGGEEVVRSRRCLISRRDKQEVYASSYQVDGRFRTGG